MKIDSPLLSIIKEALEINKAKVIKDNESYLFVNDKTAKIFYIVVHTDSVDIQSLMNIGKSYQDTLCVISEIDLNLELSNSFKHFINAVQYTYYGDKFVIDTPYQIDTVKRSDLLYLKNHYLDIGEEDAYLVNAIDRGMLKAVDNKGNILGFIGEHPEHAIGMLYVDEKYRHQGIGTTLEKSMINKFIGEGKIPFTHIARNNGKSLNLQASLGLKEDKGYINWYFN